MTVLIQAEGVVKTYAGAAKVEAVRGIDLTVERGEFVALMGPSGSGKSTLLNLLTGLDRPSAGEVWLDGQRIDRMSEASLAKMRRRKIGVVFQFFNLLPTLSAAENVELPMLLVGRGRRAARKAAIELLDVPDVRRPTNTLTVSEDYALAEELALSRSGSRRRRRALG